MPMPNAPFYLATFLSFRSLKLVFIFLCLPGYIRAVESAGIDIPLTIRETAGIPRHQWLITTGVPLPQGAVRTPEQLQIMDSQGGFVPAQFNVASRWWADGSIRWIHCDFAASVKANSTATYYLRKVVSLPEFPSPIGLMPRGRDFEIITGPLRMVLLGNSNQILDQVWVDEGWGYNFDENNKIMDGRNFWLTLTCDGHSYHASDWKNRTIEVETVNALRAVIKISGSFALAEQKEKKLNYEARITLYGGKTYFKIDLTIFDDNLRSSYSGDLLQDLTVLLKLDLESSRQKFTFGGTIDDHRGDFHQNAAASLFQFTPSRYQLLGAIEGRGIVGDSGPMNLGWVDLSDDDYGLSVGIRWFSSLFPKGFEVRSDGTLAIKLFPLQAPALKISNGFCRTHQLLFYFHGKRDFASGQVRNTMLGFQNPVYVAAPSSTYLNDSICRADFSRYTPIDREQLFSGIVSVLETSLVRSRDAISAQMGSLDLGGVPGLLRFGDTLHFWGNKEAIEAGSDWQQFIGDFAHALYLHFFRTNDLRSLMLAEQSTSFTADFIKTHESNALTGELSVRDDSGDPVKLPLTVGIRRFYQTEGLLDSYLLTGCPRSLEAAKRTLEELLGEDKISRSRDAARLGNILFCLLRGYEVLGDRRFLERSNQLVNGWISWQSGDRTITSKSSILVEDGHVQIDQTASEGNAWQYGILWDSLLEYERVTGRHVVSGLMKAEAERLLLQESKWDTTKKRLKKHPQLSFMLARAFESTCEDTQDHHCRELAFECIRSVNEQEFTVDEPGTFGLLFAEPQRFVSLLELEKSSIERYREPPP